MILSDQVSENPFFAAILLAIKPMLPVLARMAEDKALSVLEDWAKGGSDAAMQALRESSTPLEWSDICAAMVDEANLTAMAAVDDRDQLRKAVFQVILALAGAVIAL